MKRLACWVGLLALASCPEQGGAAKTAARVRRTGGTTFELVPSPGQLPYCLAFTRSEKGVMRQLTMSSKNVSFECKADKPVGGRMFKTPLDEGPIKLWVLFSSEPVNAASVTQQLLEKSDFSKLAAMEFRLPGRVQLETLEFTPEADTPPAVGEVVGGQPAGPDAGT